MPGILDALISISRQSGSTSNFAPPPVHVVGPIAPLLLGQILCQVSVKYSGGPKDRGCVPKK